MFHESPYSEPLSSRSWIDSPQSPQAEPVEIRPSRISQEQLAVAERARLFHVQKLHAYSEPSAIDGSLRSTESASAVAGR